MERRQKLADMKRVAQSFAMDGLGEGPDRHSFRAQRISDKLSGVGGIQRADRKLLRQA